MEANGGFDAHGGGGDAVVVGEAGGAAGAVAAHSGGGAVGVDEVHAEVGGRLGGRADQDEAVAGDAGMGGAEAGDEVLGGRKGAVGVVDDDEVVAGTVHFGERKHFSEFGLWIRWNYAKFCQRI